MEKSSRPGAFKTSSREFEIGICLGWTKEYLYKGTLKRGSVLIRKAGGPGRPGEVSY